MKKALVLAGLFLCSTGVFAAESQQNQVVDGKKRNEENYEKWLQKTGWASPKETQQEKTPASTERATKDSPSKSS